MEEVSRKGAKAQRTRSYHDGTTDTTKTNGDVLAVERFVVIVVPLW